MGGLSLFLLSYSFFLALASPTLDPGGNAGPEQDQHIALLCLLDLYIYTNKHPNVKQLSWAINLSRTQVGTLAPRPLPAA